jgi:predicted Zn-dependent peptidase
MVPAWRLGEGLALLAGLLRFRPVSQPALDTEWRVIDQERRLRSGRSPHARGLELVQRSLFPAGHPYRESPTGRPGGAEPPAPAAVEEFRNRHYTAGRAVVCAVGDVDPQRLWDEVENRFGALPGAREDAPEEPPANGTGVPTTNRLQASPGHREPAPVTRVYYAFRAPGDGARSWPASALLARCLTLGRGSVLRRSLVHGAGLAAEVRSLMVPMRDATTVALAVTAAPRADPDALRDTLLASLDRVRRDGPPEEAVRRAGAKALTDFYTKVQRFDLRADRIAALSTFFDDPSPMEDEATCYRSAQPEEVHQAARSCLRRDRSTVVELVAGAAA